MQGLDELLKSTEAEGHRHPHPGKPEALIQDKVLRGEAEGAGAVEPGEKEAREESYCSLRLPEKRV